MIARNSGGEWSRREMKRWNIRHFQGSEGIQYDNVMVDT